VREYGLAHRMDYSRRKSRNDKNKGRRQNGGTNSNVPLPVPNYLFTFFLLLFCERSGHWSGARPCMLISFSLKKASYHFKSANLEMEPDHQGQHCAVHSPATSYATATTHPSSSWRRLVHVTKNPYDSKL
jgi:hypothetical protein